MSGDEREPKRQKTGPQHMDVTVNLHRIGAPSSPKKYRLGPGATVKRLLALVAQSCNTTLEHIKFADNQSQALEDTALLDLDRCNTFNAYLPTNVCVNCRRGKSTTTHDVELLHGALINDLKKKAHKILRLKFPEEPESMHVFLPGNNQPLTNKLKIEHTDYELEPYKSVRVRCRRGKSTTTHDVELLHGALIKDLKEKAHKILGLKFPKEPESMHVFLPENNQPLNDGDPIKHTDYELEPYKPVRVHCLIGKSTTIHYVELLPGASIKDLKNEAHKILNIQFPKEPESMHVFRFPRYGDIDPLDDEVTTDPLDDEDQIEHTDYELEPYKSVCVRWQRGKTTTTHDVELLHGASIKDLKEKAHKILKIDFPKEPESMHVFLHPRYAEINSLDDKDKIEHTDYTLEPFMAVHVHYDGNEIAIHLEHGSTAGQLKQEFLQKMGLQPSPKMQIFASEVSSPLKQLDDSELLKGSEFHAAWMVFEQERDLWYQPTLSDHNREALDHYKTAGVALKEDATVLSIADAVIRHTQNYQTASSENPLETVIIDGSSGVGKTQLPFALANVDRFVESCNHKHVVLCNLQKTQHIYIALAANNWHLRRFVQRDLAEKDLTEYSCGTFSPQSSWWTATYLARLFDLVCNPTAATTISALREQVQSQTKPPVLFIDEVPMAVVCTKFAIQLARNICRVVGILPVMMGTDSTVANIVTKSESSRASSLLWARVICKLPSTNVDTFGVAFDSSSALGIFLLAEARRARPWFVELMVQAYQLVDPNLSDAQKLDHIASHVARAITSMKKGVRKYNVHPYFLLDSSFQRDPARVGMKPASPRLIAQHIAVPGQDSDIQLWLKGDNLENDKGQLFAPHSRFCEPNEECLPHLGLAGAKDLPAFVDAQQTQVRTCKAFDTIARQQCVPDFSNSNAKKRDGDYLEAMVAAAACVASHVDGVAGTTFATFFSEFFKEITGLEELSADDVHTCCGSQFDVPVPYLSVPNCKWPTDLTDIPGTLFGNLNRPTDQQQHDVTISGNIQIEVKHREKLAADSVTGILKRAIRQVNIVVCETMSEEFHSLQCDPDLIMLRVSVTHPKPLPVNVKNRAWPENPTRLVIFAQLT